MTISHFKNISKHKLIVLFVAAILVAVLTVLAFADMARSNTDEANKAVAVVNNQEKAFENVIKESLKLYYVVHSEYPADYQTLLDDVKSNQATYGVGDEGITELTNIDSKLRGFSYERGSSGQAYKFTYAKVRDGKVVTIHESYKQDPK
jgi:hypothetical protein